MPLVLDIKEIFEPIKLDLLSLDDRLLHQISPSSRSLCSILQDIFAAGGKRIRPALSLLLYKALKLDAQADADEMEKIFLIAEISELIHTASLVHDDIIDNSLVRRGKPSTNSKWNNAVTVISGDFMFARAAVNLGKVGNNDITLLFAQVLEHLCDGEIWQVEKKYSTDIDWQYYYNKTFKKTASLFEAAAVAPSIAMEASEELVLAAREYGKHLGIAFQLVDDILDFTATSEQLGKPAFADLKDGHITIPVLIALEESLAANKEDYERLLELISALAGDKENQEITKEIFAILQNYDAINQSFAKVKEHINAANAALKAYPDSIYKTSLINLAEFTGMRAF